jgi:glycosyltransferase involved in cell wall biosynthesis
MTMSSPVAAPPGQPCTVLHIIPTLERGGAERQLSMLAAEHARRGYNVHVAVRRTGGLVQEIKGSGVRIHDLGNIRSVDPRLLLAIRRVIIEIKPDIVQTWLPQMDILGGLGVLASRRTPWIVTERTSGGYYRKEIPAIAWLRLWLARYSSAVVANSSGGERYWREDGDDTLKLLTIYNALDLNRIREAVGRGGPRPHASPLILVVGRFDREKSFDIVLQAVADIPADRSVNVMMIGEGAERSRLEQMVEAASLSDRVKLPGHQPDWWRWLGVADGLISMGRYEGNPNVALEAMAGGCPVIVSDTPAHREVADESSAIFVPVDDVSALSSAIVQLIADKDAARQRARRASERVGSMTLTAMADAYEAVYREVMSGND